MKKIILSHPTGNANVRAAAKGLQEANLLKRFYTSVACFPNTFLFKLGGIKPFSELRRRLFSSSLEKLTYTNVGKEFARIVSGKLKINKLIKHETGIFSVHSVYCSQDNLVAKHILNDKENTFGAVYAYEDGALESFKAAKECGKLSFYELPIPYWRTFHKLLEDEKINNPDWAVSLTGLKDSPTKLRRKDAELELADVLFVANSFTAKSLSLYPGELKATIKVLPYGFPPVNGSRVYENLNGAIIKLLFVGSLSQQKGLANLFEAIEGLSDKVSLTIVGRKTTEECEPLNKGLERYRWIPSLPHAKVLELMREHDVLVFPSLFEGFGMVITEAMAQGTPVITTRNTAGVDLINDGENGWLIEAGSTKELRLAIENVIKTPHLIATVGKKAMETAKQRPWDVYSRELGEAVKEFLDRNTIEEDKSLKFRV